MSIITPKQCRAARQLLTWTQSDLSIASGIGVATIGTFEKEKEDAAGVTTSTINELRRALEGAGIIFLDSHGVKLRSQDTYSFNGSSACGNFFEQMAAESNGEILAYIKSHDMMTMYCGDPSYTILEWLERLDKTANVKCILADSRPFSYRRPTFEVWPVPNLAVAPTSFFIYNDKLAMVFVDTRLEMNIIVMYAATLAKAYQSSFETFLHGMNQYLPARRLETPSTFVRA